MKFRLTLLYLLFLFAFISACKEEEDDTIDIPEVEEIEEEMPVINPDGTEQYLSLESDYIFDQQKLPTFELNLSESSLALINSDPAAEQYVEGSLTFEGETISPVGIRYKGSIGAFVGCVSGNNLFNPSGSKTCTKLSMKIKINWEGSDNQFYGLKKLQFHSQNNDPSQMHERLAYWLFREMGVPAPRSVHAKLFINGDYYGLYALTEQIDGRFARFNFEDGTGNVYKEVWPLNMNGQAFGEQTYLSHLKTNEDENPSAQIIRSFAQQVADADPSNIQSVISEGMDLNEILSYAVVDRTIRHDDGPFHWYCNGGYCESHNFYWYESSDGKLHLIPWDMDNAFENIIEDANPVTPIVDGWGETSANCQPFGGGGFFGIQQWSAACDKLTAGWVSFEEEHTEIMNQFMNGPFSEAQVIQQLTAWETQIRDATIEAKEANSDAISIGQWESALSSLKTQLEYARNN